MPLRTTLHKCDVTYVVSPAYKGGEGVKKYQNSATYYVHCARPLTFSTFNFGIINCHLFRGKVIDEEKIITNGVPTYVF